MVKSSLVIHYVFSFGRENKVCPNPTWPQDVARIQIGATFWFSRHCICGCTRLQG